MRINLAEDVEPTTRPAFSRSANGLNLSNIAIETEEDYGKTHISPVQLEANRAADRAWASQRLFAAAMNRTYTLVTF